MAQIDPVADADHADAETRYRNQLGREMFELGWQAGLAGRQAAAEAARQAAWGATRPRTGRPDAAARPQRPCPHRGSPVGTWRPRTLRRPAPRRLPRPGRTTPTRTRSGGRLMPELTMTPSGSGGSGMAVQTDSAPGGGTAVQSRGGSSGGLVASGPEAGIEV